MLHEDVNHALASLHNDQSKSCYESRGGHEKGHRLQGSTAGVFGSEFDSVTHRALSVRTLVRTFHESDGTNGTQLVL